MKPILIKMPFMWHDVSFFFFFSFFFPPRDNLLKDSAVYKIDFCYVGITENQGARVVIKLLNLLLWVQVM